MSEDLKELCLLPSQFSGSGSGRWQTGPREERDVVCARSQLRKPAVFPGQQQAEGIVERVIHHPHAGGCSGQGSKALGLLFEIKQGGLVESRSAGQVACSDRGVQQIEQLLVVLWSETSCSLFGWKLPSH